MTRRSNTVWLVVAVLFLVVNAVGAVYALTQGELPHAGIHAVLGLLSAWAVGQLAARRIAGA